METKIIDECEMKIKLNDEFVVSRSEYEEFFKEYQDLINKYRI